jgi:sigma-B regulation protein RsbU (phosphoserine phosphatase)
MRILIAEDERITRMTLERQLKSWGHEVVAADDGEQAWEKFNAATGAAAFDIVMTDWEMPRLSGVELVRRIRGTPRAVYTYVVILTSRTDKADIVDGIEAGADDFISKPFDREELRVRLLAGERVVRLERALNRQNAELRDANQRIKSGLEAAARVQQSMLPKANVVTPRVRSAWKYVPTDELAGDAIGLHLIDDRFVIAYVLDVSGHGVPAALLSVSAMHAMEPIPQESSLLRNAMTEELGTVQRPSRVAAELNRRFRAGENDGRYLTMILCVLDTRDGRLYLTSAGHPPPLVLRGGGSERVALPDAGGFPIAIVDGAEYEDACVQLQPGDRVCLFSDGVLEQSNTSGDGGDMFGEERLIASLASRGGVAPDSVVGEVVNDLSAWAGEGAAGGFTDDVSVVIVEWVGP